VGCIALLPSPRPADIPGLGGERDAELLVPKLDAFDRVYVFEFSDSASVGLSVGLVNLVSILGLSTADGSI
jgi:hypothetical protein